MSFLGVLLFPFAVAYDAITTVRNRLYDTGRRPSAKFDVPLIGVGNLSVGGTGKTPMIEYLIRLLSDRYNIATLSRGYGRRTRGMRIATEKDDAASLGDEPLQFYRKFKGRAIVAVGEERALAIPGILHEHPDVNVILLDDAFQHRRVQPSFQILLTDYSHLFVRDYLLPAGRLRESRAGAARADVIVVTKCPPAIFADEMISIESAIRRYSKKAVFFTKIAYGNLVPVGKLSPYRPDKVIIVCGIANPAPMNDYLAQHFKIAGQFVYPDHHVYSQKDIEDICTAAVAEGAAVVTTEKDMVKIDPEVFQKHAVPLHYLPIETEFLKHGKEFDEMVLNAVKSNGH